MADTFYNTGTSHVELEQPINVVMSGKKTREFVAECAAQMFCNINYDLNTKKNS